MHCIIHFQISYSTGPICMYSTLLAYRLTILAEFSYLDICMVTDSFSWR